jgi:hypothetical protein
MLGGQEREMMTVESDEPPLRSILNGLRLVQNSILFEALRALPSRHDRGKRPAKFE